MLDKHQERRFVCFFVFIFVGLLPCLSVCLLACLIDCLLVCLFVFNLFCFSVCLFFHKICPGGSTYLQLGKTATARFSNQKADFGFDFDDHNKFDHNNVVGCEMGINIDDQGPTR